MLDFKIHSYIPIEGVRISKSFRYGSSCDHNRRIKCIDK